MRDSMSGLGVMTYKFFAKGDLIGAITGEIIHDIRQHSLQIEPDKHLYDLYFSGYFLHSCSPNIELDMKNLMVYAIKDIKPKEFLLMDYAQTEDVLFKQFSCNCGSENCRGWITGRKETVDEQACLACDPLVPKKAVG